jgi:hypothetical protein
MLFRTLLLLALAASLGSEVQAQRKRVTSQQNPNSSVSADKAKPGKDSGIMVGSPEQEMLARQDLKAAEKDHLENLERAREAAQLSTEIRDTYLNNKALGPTEKKKLERLEKVTRKIRSEAGGSDGEVTLEDVPTQIEPALARIVEIAEKMRKVVEKTPRQVVSAAVIERANELLEIIHYLRTFTR